tara:strand:- start:3030 stop:4190 length:1161 start_codon:yes stop_codon:yes gene_type:complete
MNLNDYVVAIPSYKRPKTLNNKSLRVLKEQKINPNRIHIFVSDKEQEQIYKDEIPKNDYNKIIVGKPGIKNIRNFMPKYFKEGQKIFYMDDDIKQVYQNFNQNKVPNNLNKNNYDKKNNKLTPIKNLHKFIENAFNLAKKKKMDNWGVYPVENPYFMKPTTKNTDDYTSTYLSYIIGFMTGVINNRKAEIRTIDDKEDYERSIKYYLKDDGVLRFNNVTCRTNCYKEPGGMQVERTNKRIHDSAVYLTKKYPQLCKLNTGKKSGFTEVRLKDKRNNIKTINLSKSSSCSSKSKSNLSGLLNSLKSKPTSYISKYNSSKSKLSGLLNSLKSKPSSCRSKSKSNKSNSNIYKSKKIRKCSKKPSKKYNTMKQIPISQLSIKKCGRKFN